MSTEWDVLEKAGISRRYGRGALIYSQGERGEWFYCLLRGKVEIFLSSADGQEKRLTVREAGSVFGEAAFFDGLPRTSSARALEPSEVVVVGREALTDAAAKDPDLALRLLELLARTVRMLSAQVDAMAFLRADRRVAQLLAGLCEQLPDGRTAARVTHEDVASLAGLSRVTVSRVLGEFCRMGLIKTGYRMIFLEDRERLATFQGEPGGCKFSGG